MLEAISAIYPSFRTLTDEQKTVFILQTCASSPEVSNPIYHMQREHNANYSLAPEKRGGGKEANKLYLGHMIHLLIQRPLCLQDVYLHMAIWAAVGREHATASGFYACVTAEGLSVALAE